jgi:hypothetical protein
MKKTLLSLLGIVSIATIGYSQCDRKLKITSSKTEYLNEKLEVQRSVDEPVIVTISKTTITIEINGEDEKKMTGTITPVSCQWKTPFKDGKTIMKAEIADQRGDTKSTSITIEGKDGKVTFLLELNESQDKKIRLTMDTFEEQK